MARAPKVRRSLLNPFWFAATAANWLAIVAAIVLAFNLNHIVAYAVAVLVIGTRQHALAVLSHDATHFHVSRSKRLNDLLSNLLAAWPMAFSSSGYRRWHLQHHRTVGTEDDPELMMYRKFGSKWSPGASRVKLFVTDLMGLGSYELLVLWHDLLQWRPPEPAWRRIEETLGLLLWPAIAAGVAIWSLGWRAALVLALLWYGSLFTSFFAVYRLRCYSEHIGTEWTHRLAKPPLWQRLLYLPANTWMHWEHHTWPAIPLRQMRHAVPALEAAERARTSGTPAGPRGDALAGVA